MTYYELYGMSTEDQKLRYRAYTTSERVAKEFEAAVPKIQFSDSGHGVVFGYRLAPSKKPRITECEEHVKLYWTRKK